MNAMSDMSYWDYLTLAVALGIIVIYLGVHIKRLLNPDDSGCSGCSVSSSASSCSQEPTANCNTTVVTKTKQQKSDS